MLMRSAGGRRYLWALGSGLKGYGADIIGRKGNPSEATAALSGVVLQTLDQLTIRTTGTEYSLRKQVRDVLPGSLGMERAEAALGSVVTQAPAHSALCPTCTRRAWKVAGNAGSPFLRRITLLLTASRLKP